MTWQQAWAIKSQKTPVEVGRLLAYVATGGASGTVGSGDCQVRELDVPGSKIRVMPGAAVIKSRYPSAGQQSYAARNPDQDEVPVTATGSAAGRSDLVVVRVLDDQYAGVANPNTETWICEDVDPGTESVEDAIGQGKTGLEGAEALARLDIPASTATITQGMIVDLRKMVAPRTKQFQWTTSASNAAPNDYLTHVKPGYQVWPDFASISIDVPEWAVYANVTAVLTCGVSNRGGSLGDTAIGGLQTVIAGRPAPDIYYNVTVGGTVETATFIVGQTAYMPANVRGTTQTLEIQGYRETANNAELYAQWGTTVSYLVTFYESPDPEVLT